MEDGIRLSVEAARGCGYRKPGGLYLVAPTAFRRCGILPIPLEKCPCCSGGFLPNRGWTWIEIDRFLVDRECLLPRSSCFGCPLSLPDIGRSGLIWVGTEAYPSPAGYMDEAQKMGISRRIRCVPRDFEVGKTMVFLAHQRTVPLGEGKFMAGIFSAFRPTGIEYVVRGDETPEELEGLRSRGIEPVRVIPDVEASVEFVEEDDDE